MSFDPGIGARYQENTKYLRDQIPPRPEMFGRIPALKKYDEPLAHIELPTPDKTGGPELWATIAARRSQRVFTDAPMSLAHLSQLLWATTGLTRKPDSPVGRAAASAGALYPNETYIFVNNVTDCSVGIFHYEVLEHRLAMISEGAFGGELAGSCLEQKFCATANIVLCWAAVIARCAQKYADRAYRYIYMDAGHMGANAQLAAQALGFGSVNVGAFFDGEVNGLIGIDGTNETAIYLTAIGTLGNSPTE